MSPVTVDSPTRVPSVPEGDAADHPDREPKPSRTWALLEALAYVGSSVDAATALAARRFARIRDQERRRGRW